MTNHHRTTNTPNRWYLGRSYDTWLTGLRRRPAASTSARHRGARR
jgi:hypothetical protein